MSAIGYIHIGTMAGKLNGVMPATTPSVLAVLTLKEFRCAAGIFHIFHTAHEFSMRIVAHLAVFLGNQGYGLVGILLQQFLEAKHDARPLDWRCVAPLRESRLRSGNGFFNRGFAGQRYLADNMAGGRVVDVLGPVAIGNHIAIY